MPVAPVAVELTLTERLSCGSHTCTADLTDPAMNCTQIHSTGRLRSYQKIPLLSSQSASSAWIQSNS